PELPATAAAVASGDISSEHAQVISSAIRHLPTSLDRDVVTGAEKTLAGHARDLDPSDLKTVARQLHLHLNPDGNLPDDKPSRRELTFRRDAYGMDVIRGRLDAEGSATVQAALAPLMQPHPAEDGVRDPRSPARRCADALVELSEQTLGAGGLPTMAGEKPHVTVTIGLNDLRDGTGHATLNTGAPVSPETARRIACDATIIPILLGSEGEPLDIGRATRTIPPGIRRAIVARDLGCIHPDCDAPAPRCEAHHVQHWTNGGPTALNNLVLLCPRHHWTIHHDQWQITFHEGIPHVIPPPLLDPQQRPQRNTRHHPADPARRLATADAGRHRSYPDRHVAYDGEEIQP
ncbi:MAG TPA: DUF222 domain-containing protein, partial [Mycobacteriales bacterium]|nr:DUF222 domain-containing protein [Mycobacteriales bacterium]